MVVIGLALFLFLAPESTVVDAQGGVSSNQVNPGVTANGAYSVEVTTSGSTPQQTGSTFNTSSNMTNWGNYTTDEGSNQTTVRTNPKQRTNAADRAITSKSLSAIFAMTLAFLLFI